jgi:hypothetical protein
MNKIRFLLVNFLTLLKRNISDYIHIRKGPSKLVLLVLFNLLATQLNYFYRNSVFL